MMLSNNAHQLDAAQMGRILIVDDEAPLSMALRRVLRSQGHDVDWAASGEDGLQRVRENAPYDLIMLDIRLPCMDGIDVLERIKVEDPFVSVLMMTGYATVDTAVNALKLGAFDYLTKPFDDIFQVCEEVAQHAISQAKLARSTAPHVRLVTQELELGEGRFEGMVGRAQSMQRVYEMIAGSAPTDATVLIQGETGTGKELVARALHSRSSRSERPFVPINCAALPTDLLESELFGHERGAFTGAHQAKQGLFEVADGGTLFLDEVAEIPMGLQAKLLRVLEEGEIRRVGAGQTRHVDVRLLAATHKALKEQCNLGAFRLDLFYRLAVVKIMVPALNQRPGDIPLLAQHFLTDFALRTGRPLDGFDQSALDVLTSRDWPGNVRELRNVLERTFIFSQGPFIHAMDLPEEILDAPGNWYESRPENLTDLHFTEAKQKAVEAFEHRYLRDLLDRTGGNISHAAREAGMDRSNFRRLMKKLGVQS